MNNNLNFSKNVFGGNGNTQIAGSNITSYSQDGGRRSVEEVRESQLNADRGINPDAGREFQVELNNEPYQNPLNSSAMTGAYILPDRQDSGFNNQMPNADMQMDATRSRIQAMQNLNKRGF